MYWQQIQHNLTLREPGPFLIKKIYRRASGSLVGPVESILHWSGGPAGWNVNFDPWKHIEPWLLEVVADPGGL